MMDRRTFVGRVVGGLLAAPLAARAQQPKVPLIGFLGTTSYSVQGTSAAAFAQRLRELGWVEGRTVAIEYRWGEGSNERIAETVAEFVRLKVDIIVTGGDAVLAAKRATTTIPIVFGLAVDPVGTGMVASLSRPGGNVTGMSLQSTDLTGKRLGLCRELAPGLRSIAILANANYPAAMLEMGQAEASARMLGIRASRLEVRRVEDIAPAIAGFKGSDFLYVCNDAFAGTNSVDINNAALAARLPAMHGSISFLKTAKALGITVPQSLLVRADEVIQ